MQTAKPMFPGQTEVVTVTQELDQNGNPGQMGPNPLTWQSANTSALTIGNVSADGSSATLTVLANATPGTSVNVTVSGAASDSQIVQQTFSVPIQELPARSLVFSFANPQ